MTRTFENQPGLAIVLSAPSGGGKTTLCRRVMQSLQGLKFSISHTTRAPRGKEVDGVDYYFVDDREFDRMVAADEFLEWAPVHKHRYGTARATARREMQQGVDLLFDIDVQGGQQISRLLPDAQLVFILPPSFEILKERLASRGVDDAIQMQARLAAAADEIRAAHSYKYIIVNDDLERAADELRSIIVASRLAARPKAHLLTHLLTHAEKNRHSKIS